MKNKLKLFVFSALLLGSLHSIGQKHHDSLKMKPPHVKSTGVNKDGTPDMRLKANKGKVVTPTPPVVTPKVVTPVVAPKTTKVTPAVTPKVATADKMIGTDSKGRQIFQGPRGGKYYINKNGNKEYIKE